MSDPITPRDAGFFYDHAGYSHTSGADEEEARQFNAHWLADAHALLARAVDAGVARIAWEYDDIGADAAGDDEQAAAINAGDVEVLAARLETACGCCGSFTVAASLGGIQLDARASGRDPYCDVVEAELALEAEAELRALLAGDEPPAHEAPGPDSYRGPDGILGNDFSGPAAAGW